MSTKSHPKMSTKYPPKRGLLMDKSVCEMSRLLSTRCHLLCPRDVCHPNFQQGAHCVLHYLYRGVQSIQLLSGAIQQCISFNDCILLWGFLSSSSYYIYHVHYDPLMMSQKEAPRKHPSMLPRKVANMVWISVPLTFVEYDGCFLLCTSSSRRKYPGSTHHYLLMAGNSHQIGNLSRKHAWVLPGCFLLWHHQRVIVYKVFWFFPIYLAKSGVPHDHPVLPPLVLTANYENKIH